MCFLSLSCLLQRQCISFTGTVGDMEQIVFETLEFEMSILEWSLKVKVSNFRLLTPT